MTKTDSMCAAELCDLAGVPHLPAYLGHSPRTDATTLKNTFRERRRFLQGMSGNPKFADEASLVIRQAAALERMIDQLDVHLADRATAMAAVTDRARVSLSELIAVSVGAGSLSDARLAAIRRVGVELGIRTDEIDAMYQEIDAIRPEERPAPPVILGTADASAGDLQLHRQLGVPLLTDDEDLDAAIRAFLVQARPAPVEYDELSEEVQREWSPQPRLEILGDPDRTFAFSQGGAERIVVRNAGLGPMPGVVETDVPWLSVSPRNLDPLVDEQVVVVSLDANQVALGDAVGLVVIRTERGHTAQVTFTLVGTWTPRRLAAVGLMGGLVWSVVAILVVVLGILVGTSL